MDKPGSPFFNIFRKLFDPRKAPPPPATSSIPPVSQPPQTPAVGYDKNNKALLSQLQEANKYRRIVEDAVRHYQFRSSVICGIVSRESAWGLTLKPPGPGGTGDFSLRPPKGNRKAESPPDGGGYGRGLMQVDYDWHEFARTGNWRDPQANIFYGCEVLSKNREFFTQRMPQLQGEQQLQALVAAYNAGATATLEVLLRGEDVDSATTGKDYSKDVFYRSDWFRLWGWN